MRKIYDMLVKVNEYTTSTGEKKVRWQNVGVVMERDNGKPFVLLNRTFNPAGVPADEERESILITLCEPKQKNGYYSQGRGYGPAPEGDPVGNYTFQDGPDREERGDIPF